MNIISTLKSTVKDLFQPKAPKVSCPKCGDIHEINGSCRCPSCGLKYKLPDEYSAYVIAAAKKESETKNGAAESAKKDTGSPLEMRDNALMETGKKQRSINMGRFVKLGISAVVISLIFMLFSLLFFRDKDALIFDVGEYKNQPVFYTTQDGTLHCAFPNDKGCSIGKGTIGSYLSSADGKHVYLTYSGVFGTAKPSNYVIGISKFGEKAEVISEDETYLPKIAAGGDNKYLYIMTPKDEVGNLFDLTLSVDGKKEEAVAQDIRELAVSTSGRYALVSVDDSGASKLMLYNAAKKELANPGIKNAHPLSIDNKGEYMIYARKSTADSTDIIVEKSTMQRVEIPVFKDTELKRIIFSEDRRTFSIEYDDRTVFYTCGDKDYIISATSSSSAFGYKFNENVCHNVLSFKEIPEVSNVKGTALLPYFYYDKVQKYVYRITKEGAKEPVFDTHIIDDLKVSENGRVAFVSGNILYTGKLDRKANDLCEIMNFTNKTLIDISPDGKLICYTDSDGNMFTAEYGKKNTAPKKVAVDPDVVRYSSNSKTLITISGNVAHVYDKKGVSKKLCESIVAEYTAVSKDDLSELFYVVSEKDEASGTEKKMLYLYSDRKSKLITDKLDKMCLNKDSTRLDRTLSDYVDISTPATENAQNTETNDVNNVTSVPGTDTTAPEHPEA